MNGIEISSVRKVYSGGIEAIKGIDVSIADGELAVLVGPSGCGKSTLLRMIAGLETITEGEIRIGDKVVNRLEPAERDIAMVFQNYALYPHMTVRANLEYGLKNRRTPKDQIAARVSEAARILEIEPYLDRKPRQLSGGQRQRVAMGRAIVRQPSAFLFDEPLSNLDAKLRGQMRLEIRRLQRTFGTTSVYVTHDQLEAMTLADKLVVMNNGRIEQIGTPLDVYDNPATTFVAGFIGSPPMNFFSAAGLKAALAGQGLGHLDTAETIGIRPEHVERTAAGGGLLDATVEFIEALGAETLLHARSDAGERAIVRSANPHEAMRPGLRIGLNAAPGHLFAYGADGNRIGLA